MYLQVLQNRYQNDSIPRSLTLRYGHLHIRPLSPVNLGNRVAQLALLREGMEPAYSY